MVKRKFDQLETVFEKTVSTSDLSAGELHLSAGELDRIREIVGLEALTSSLSIFAWGYGEYEQKQTWVFSLHPGKNTLCGFEEYFSVKRLHGGERLRLVWEGKRFNICVEKERDPGPDSVQASAGLVSADAGPHSDETRVVRQPVRLRCRFDRRPEDMQMEGSSSSSDSDVVDEDVLSELWACFN